MSAQTAKSGMMAFIDKPIKIKCTSIIERHAIADKKVGFRGFEILNTVDRLHRGVVVAYLRYGQMQ